jgi:F-type H+-transporting ATPase subunit epsilon
MNLEIITPDKKVFSGEVEIVTLPGTSGSFQILKEFTIDGGVVEVLNNKVLVLAEAVL